MSFFRVLTELKGRGGVEKQEGRKKLFLLLSRVARSWEADVARPTRKKTISFNNKFKK